MIWNLKQKTPVKYIAYCPKGFEKLFFAADEVVIIPESLNSFSSFSEVSEYIPSQSSGFFLHLRKSIKDLCRLQVYKLLNILQFRNSLLSCFLNVSATDRAQKFLFKSGVYSWCKKDFKNRVLETPGEKATIFASANYLIFRESDLCLGHVNLDESFKYFFGELFSAIENGIIDCFQEKYPKSSAMTKGVVYLRSRNYRNKQIVHNTKSRTVIPIVEGLLQNGINVVNIGSPLLSLIDQLGSANHHLYSELDNLLTIDDELTLLNGPIVCGADAGLFVLMCCLPNPLISLTPEWSERLGIKLMDARRNVGMHSDLGYYGEGESKIIRHILAIQ